MGGCHTKTAHKKQHKEKKDKHHSESQSPQHNSNVLNEIHVFIENHQIWVKENQTTITIDVCMPNGSMWSGSQSTISMLISNCDGKKYFYELVARCLQPGTHWASIRSFNANAHELLLNDNGKGYTIPLEPLQSQELALKVKHLESENFAQARQVQGLLLKIQNLESRITGIPTQIESKSSKGSRKLKIKHPTRWEYEFGNTNFHAVPIDDFTHTFKTKKGIITCIANGHTLAAGTSLTLCFYIDGKPIGTDIGGHPHVPIAGCYHRNSITSTGWLPLNMVQRCKVSEGEHKVELRCISGAKSNVNGLEVTYSVDDK